MSEPLLPRDPASIGGYRLLARLGAGGMGVVYLGRSASGALAAVKVVHPELAGESGFLERFRREAAAARRVRGPWTAPLLGAGPEDPTPWLATAFVPGPSLAETVERFGPLPARSVRALGRMLAAALRAVHAAGLVHRDVKPGNVLLAVDGPRLVDFGIARAAEETALTSAGLVVGTPGFLSPEQAGAGGGELGPPSDVFSLGALLAYAATGRAPFGSGSVEALLYRTVHDEPDLAGLDPAEDSDNDLLALLRDCLAKDPSARPTAHRIETRLVEDAAPGGGWLPEEVVRDIADRSAAMLALPDIEPTAAGEPGPDTAEDTPGTAPRRSRRRVLLLGAGAAVLAAAGGGTALWATRDEEDAAPGEPRWALGVHGDLSGPGRHYGRAQERGARLAVEQYNSRRDKPFPLALRTGDDQGSPERAKAAARRFAADRGVLAVLGPTTEAAAGGVLDVCDEALLPVLLTAPGGMLTLAHTCRSVLHCRVRDAAVAFPLSVHLVKEAKVSRPGLLQDRTAETYAWETTAITADTLRQAGLDLYPRVVPAGLRDLGREVRDIVRAEVDSFVYAGLAAGGASAARALAAADFTGPRLGTQALVDPEFLDRAGEAAEGWLLAASFTDPTALEGAGSFTAAFRRRFDAAPGPLAAEAYDAARLAIQEIVRATRDRRPPSRGDLARLLRRSTFRGITKRYAFDRETGRFSGEGAFLYRVTDGAFRFLGPAPTGA
ncbi:putative serine or threonine protein kinase [Streptomyces albus]|uniref:Putative serine or threonine protein kinase n=1 Tax=Streptomyces albus (strain ATCC 21838 / DSM 41398 / FERM P-419 / JCM 4703 / NBRC 107858) TaxID=1081613 RepID=A0A0B5F3C3_STRA4|nr:putative serine or threonine protein kinase [Streptomyces albus]AOU79668.1 putative serine or threonine protein kinase [Streptomyces albus]AYN35389.1 eukaryotic-like serine/threonine-protein kinase [Streptomyces albus]